jgi:hypothetical protein
VPLPALRKTSSGSSDMAALGAALATDWARTSSMLRRPRRSVEAPAASPAEPRIVRSGRSEAPDGVLMSAILLVPPYRAWWWQRSGGGTSSAGLPSKKPIGFRWNPIRATGITGQSSGRGT